MEYWVDTDRYFKPTDREAFPLIHMTADWEILVLLLTEGFKPSYCKEFITDGNQNKAACFPMISLSNIDVDFALRYQRSYGTLGIVMAKSWGERNDFNPVLYLEQKSDLTKEIVTNFDRIVGYSMFEINMALDGGNTSPKSLFAKQHIKLFAHSKNYDGILVRHETLFAEKYPYGMEREWRKIIKKEKVPYFLVKEDMKLKKELNKLLDDIRIDFQLDELKGIIVETEWQEEEVKSIIKEKFKLEHFPEHIKITINCTRHVPDE